MRMETLGNVITTKVSESLSTALESVVQDTPGIGSTVEFKSANAIVATSEPTVGTVPPLSTDGSADDYLSCAYTVDTNVQNIEKMILLGSYRIGNNAARHSIIFKLPMPDSFFSDFTHPAYGQSRYFHCLRSGYNFKLLIAGAFGAQGSIILFYLPPVPRGVLQILPHNMNQSGITHKLNNYFDPDTILYGPHVLMDVARNTEVTLSLPYISYKNYEHIYGDSRRGYLVCAVYSDVYLPQTSHIDVSLYGELLDMDLQVPRKVLESGFLNQGRKFRPRRTQPRMPPVQKDTSTVIINPGPGACNLASHDVIARTESLSLAGETTGVDFRTAGCAAAIPSLRTILRRWTHIAQTSYAISSTAGSRLWEENVVFNHGIFRQLADKFLSWRGSLEFRVLVYSSTLHRGKLALSWYPMDVTGSQSTNYPYYRNAISMVFDVTDASPVLVAPFSSESWRASTAATFGVLSLHALTPLSATHSTVAKTAVSVHVLMRVGKDFQAFCPRSGTVRFKTLVDSTTSTPSLFLSTSVNDGNVDDSTSVDNDNLDNQGNPDIQMALEQRGESGNDEDQFDIDPTLAINFETTFIPIQSVDHLDFKYLFSRASYVGRVAGSTGNTKHRILNLAPPLKGILSLTRVAVYFTGELMITVSNISETSILVSHSWYNSYHYSSVDQYLTDGAIVIPPHEIKQFRVPYYAKNPLSTLTDPYAFGFLHVYVDTDVGQADVFLSLVNPNLFQLTPLPLTTTAAREISDYAISEVEEGVDDLEDQGNTCEELHLTVRRKQCIASVELHKSCRLHYFQPRCCKCQEWEYKEFIGPEPICLGPYKDVRAKFYCQCKKGIHHFQCGDHFGRQMCCGCAHIYGWLDQAEKDYFEKHVKPWRSQEDLSKEGIEPNPGPFQYVACDLTAPVFKCQPHRFCDFKSQSHQNCPQHNSPDSIMCCLCSARLRITDNRYKETDAKWLSRYGVEMNPGPVLTSQEAVAHFCATLLDPCDQKPEPMVRVSAKPKCWIMRFHFDCENHQHLAKEMCCLCAAGSRVTQDLYAATNQDQLSNQGIESNPGPTLVYKDRGMYKHYGVQVGDKIFHINTENILDAVISGKANVMMEDNIMGWETVGDEYVTVAEKYLQAGSMPDFKFNVDQNCETWARHLLGDYGPTQGEILKHRLAQCVALGMLAQFAMSSQGLGSTVQGMMTKLTDLIFGNLENQIVKLVIRAVVRILCYLILYIHSPNLMTTGVLAALLVLDATSITVDDPLKVMTKALINGDFTEFCAAVLEKCDIVDADALADTIPTFTSFVDQSMEDEGPNPKPFNDWTTCAKNIQWWMEGIVKAFKWIKDKLFPSDLNSLAKWMEENEDNIATTIALADEHLVLLKTDKEYATSSQTKKKHVALCDTISGMMLKMKDDPRLNPMISRLNILMGKLQSINFEPEAEWTHRPEPLGMWINGAPGVGKSFLTNFITKRLKEKYGWNIYANATGSNHMDGYTDQEVHVFDDFGQQREETDYTLMCNLISSVPFIVPKAEVTAKGTTYKGRAVLVTTNRRDFSSVALFDAEALERRFPFKYQIRPKPKYELNGKLNVALAMRDGALLSGNAWERNLGIAGLDKWEPLDGDTLMEEICTELMIRENIAKFMNQGNSDPLFAILEQSKIDFDWQSLEEQVAMFTRRPPKGKIQKFKVWVSDSVAKIKSFVEKNRTWFLALGAIGSIISVCSFLIPRVSMFTQSFYEGSTKVAKLSKNFKVAAAQHNAKFEDQGLMDMRHICQRLVNLRGPKGTATGLALGGKTIITYGHEEFHSLEFVKDTQVNANLSPPVAVRISDEPTDLALYQADTPFQFKNAYHLIHDEDYRGKGYLIWKNQTEYMILAVDNIRPAHPITTNQGTISSRVYMYNAKTGAGTCGGILVGLVNGNPKILGIHTSGNGVTGAANRLYSFFDQGQVTKKISEDKPKYFQPRKSAYVPSPVHVYTDVGPPVLSKNDPRLEVEVDDITVRAAEKYIGNTFDPPPSIFEHAKARLAENLSKVLEYKPPPLTYDEATSTEILDIDWTTSPGEKYKGKTKKELVVSESFKTDVLTQLANPNTYFVTYLKDELRSNEKIRNGNTRAIEACNFDYTVAFRMVMGHHYKNIMNDVEQLSEICVGINPYVYFDTIVDSLYDYNLCLDYKKFDGSLSPQVMEAAVEVFSWFASNPDLVKAIHRPTIYSTNWVSNQVWTVEGGMCSGSPCTSILNSAVNILVISTMMMSYGYDPKELRLLTYGDDCVISVPYKVDISDFKKRLKNYFGMTVTNFDKTEEFKWLSRGEISFLKRTPAILEGTTKLVGALDLDSMREKIQWTRSLNDFSSQLESFQLELALHGRGVYEKEIQELRKISPGSAWMPFDVALHRMKGICDIL
ncbi:polyprotein [grusopivirus A1]|uniref:Polyprotein n=1 Tax=grusopivirus A1 TaxID=2870359 RepID=A0AC59HC26_9PICO|nr:polyprotein [grusopivirus A1]AUW34305.1 polyprotein [grusopivirus A1]